MNVKKFRQLIFSSLLLTYWIQSSIGNNAPVFTGTYPVDVTPNEGTGTPAGTVLHTFVATDADAADTVVLSYTFDPTAATSTMFTITNGAVSLSTGRELDFETQDVYKIYCTATDGVATTGPVLLTITVQDVGEAPTLNPATTVTTFTIDESSTGTAVGSPSFTISDLDTFETHVFSIYGGTGTSYVEINAVSGAITLKTDYDREGAGIPANFYVDVKVTDKFGLTATTTYSVIVNDINDNTPVFNPTTYSFEAAGTTAVGTTMATLVATDADAESPNNALTYTIDTSSSGGYYFTIDGTALKLAHVVDFANGASSFSFNVIVTDGGTTARSATAVITVTTPTTTTTTTTTILPPAGYSWFDDQTNVLLLIMIAILAAVILGYSLLLCWRCNTYGKCMPLKCPSMKECATCCYCRELCCCKSWRDGSACDCMSENSDDSEDESDDGGSTPVKKPVTPSSVVLAAPKPLPNPFETFFMTPMDGRVTGAAPIATDTKMKYSRY